jgi:hypothetical protein
MGLDSYLYSVQHTDTNKPTDQRLKYLDHSELGYWRKANHIHGWMERLYRLKGGTEEFNCVTVQLTAKDIEQLLGLVVSKKLEPVSGFFFGSNNVPESVDTDTIKILCSALDAISDNRDVYFSSWY